MTDDFDPLLEAQASAPGAIWSDPDNPYIVDQSKYREPNGYEIIEFMSYSDALVVATNLAVTTLTFLTSEGADDETINQYVQDTQTAQNQIVQQINEFWKRLEKDPAAE